MGNPSGFFRDELVSKSSDPRGHGGSTPPSGTTNTECRRLKSRPSRQFKLSPTVGAPVLGPKPWPVIPRRFSSTGKSSRYRGSSRLARIMHETPWRDRGDGRATGQPQGLGPEAYLSVRRKVRDPRTPGRTAISAVAAGDSCAMRARCWRGAGRRLSAPGDSC